MNNVWGATEDGFYRKTYEDVLEDLHTRAKKEYGDGINLSDQSPMGKFLKIIAWTSGEMWEQFEHSHYQSHLIYATDLALDKWASNFGEQRRLGARSTTNSLIIYGDAGTRVPKGFRVSAGTELIYHTLTDVVVGDSGEVKTSIEAVERGQKYNVAKGNITQIVNPQLGVHKVENKEGLKGGLDIETDDELRERLLFKLRTPLTGDNPSQYIVWAQQIEQVGAVKPLRATPKAGFVTLIIATQNGQEADKKLIDEVTEYINGVKPVGAGLVVKSATKKNINIEVKVSISDGANKENVQADLEGEISKYLSSISLKLDKVSRAKIGNIIITHKDVNDYSDLKINDSLDNINLKETEIPVLEELNLEVI